VGQTEETRKRTTTKSNSKLAVKQSGLALMSCRCFLLQCSDLTSAVLLGYQRAGYKSSKPMERPWDSKLHAIYVAYSHTMIPEAGVDSYACCLRNVAIAIFVAPPGPAAALMKTARSQLALDISTSCRALIDLRSSL